MFRPRLRLRSRLLWRSPRLALCIWVFFRRVSSAWRKRLLIRSLSADLPSRRREEIVPSKSRQDAGLQKQKSGSSLQRTSGLFKSYSLVTDFCENDGEGEQRQSLDKYQSENHGRSNCACSGRV